MEKKNTGLIVLVVVLSLLVVGLGGYIVYDKILNNGVSDNGNADNIKDDDSHSVFISWQMASLKLDMLVWPLMVILVIIQ